jgi:hypothetical protein
MMGIAALNPSYVSWSAIDPYAIRITCRMG